MKIVMFDIDGVLIDEASFMYKYAPDFLKRKYKLEVKEVDVNKYNLADVYNLETLLEHKGYEKENAKLKAKQITQHFWNYYFLKYCSMPLKRGVKEIIDRFRQNGYLIYIVSTRGKKTKERESIIDIFIRKVAVRFLTKFQFWKNSIKIDFLELPLSIEEKIEYIRTINPEYMFEDQIDLINHILLNISDYSKVICVNNTYNIEENFPKKVIRINNFKEWNLQEELESVLIDDCRKIKERKQKYFLFYRIVKFIGKPIVFFKYCPIVLKKRRVVKDKNMAFIGNHRKKSDPIVLTSIVNQIIHWAALQRMFEGREDLFSNTNNRWRCKISALFLEWMGAVPIARSEDDRCLNTNVKSLKILAQQLQWKQASIGFFPEGTLNRNFQQQNILPVKSNQIFKLAAFTKCFIQPFSIVWIPPNTIIGNKVIVSFSYPINCENRTNEEIMEIWSNTVEKNIIEANEFIEYLIKVEKEDLSWGAKYLKMQRKIRKLKAM